eukprot:15635-Prorocentrum_minimum.AAC.1
MFSLPSRDWSPLYHAGGEQGEPGGRGRASPPRRRGAHAQAGADHGGADGGAGQEGGAAGGAGGARRERA